MNWFTQMWGGGSAPINGSEVDPISGKREDDSTQQDRTKNTASILLNSLPFSPSKGTEPIKGTSSLLDSTVADPYPRNPGENTSTFAANPIKIKGDAFAFEHGTIFSIKERIPTKFLSNVTAEWATPMTLEIRGISHAPQITSLQLDISLICYYRWHDPVMQEIALKKEKGIEAYGILFPTKISASSFYRQIIDALSKTAICTCNSPISIFRFSSETKTFVSIEEKAIFRLYHGIQEETLNFIVICKEKGGDILLHTFLEPQSCLIFTMEKSWLEITIQENEEDFSMRYALEFKEKESLSTFYKFIKTRFGEETIATVDDAVSFLSVDDYSSSDELDWNDSDYEDECVNTSTRIRFLCSSVAFVYSIEYLHYYSLILLEIRKRNSLPSNNAPDGYKNKFVEVGKKHAFVLSEAITGGDNKVQMELIQVEDGCVKSNAIIPDSQFFFNRHHITPAQALLLDDNELLITDLKDSSVYRLDANRETIVQKWEDKTMNDISLMNPRQVDSSPSSVVLGYNKNTLFSLDKRIPSKIVGPRYTYVSCPNFSCGALDQKGHIALGSAGSGEIRLYDGEEDYNKNLKRAKTLISGLGQPLLYVAVTAKGDWILGTTRKYLVLYANFILFGKQKWNGFERAMAGKMEEPYILKVLPEDLKERNLSTNLEFKKAEFDHTEASIIAIADSVAILWNIR
ncbi:hypothetical protein IE077_000589 [Cardiosporidium cionae]|uniref:Vacuolar import/degradation Vid27 C-terminal domain-containing protein n=1 Tax=Cardiosporidium cionae TaxID=476202 RepID=A0ABQ7J7M8_9APIC|nr:hypothetical protein IE077_000589 [Cardiosporidium cionae]|eukprot:KAF8819996.1 hypothetical protein IE077_000589 [Cardiosporidium cionae]